MGRAAHRVKTIVAALCLGVLTPSASAECISRLLTPNECQYWKEKRQLIYTQPATKFISVEKTDRLLDEMETFYQNYLSSVKVTGDAAIANARVTAAGMLGAAIDIDAAMQALMAANDPYLLKPVYDIECTAFWQVVAGETCPGTADLPVDPARMAALREMLAKIEAIAENPFLVLGEEWGDITDDVREIDAAYDRLKTLGRNVLPEAFDERYAQSVQSLEALLADPIETSAKYARRMHEEVSPTTIDTTKDTLESIAAVRGAMITEDIDELVSLQDKSVHEIGRMQAAEVSNMIASQGAESWLKIGELYGATTNMMAVDAAAEQYREDIATSNSLRLLENDPHEPNQPVIDDGERF